MNTNEDKVALDLAGRPDLPPQQWHPAEPFEEIVFLE